MEKVVRSYVLAWTYALVPVEITRARFPQQSPCSTVIRIYSIHVTSGALPAVTLSCQSLSTLLTGDLIYIVSD